MPLLRQSVTIQRATAGAVDVYNQPSRTFATIATVKALIQPIAGSEMAGVNNAGPVRGDYRIFMYPTDVREGDRIVRGSEIYELTFVADAGGAGRHLEIDANRVAP